MKTVENKEELMKNIATMDSYLEDAGCKEYAISLVQRGTCFVIVKDGLALKFYPSRFIGYTENSIDKHEANQNKDGRVTNVAITKILNESPMANIDYELEYCKYCHKLGILCRNKGSFGVQRKYWAI